MQKFNIATDIAVNNILVNNGFILPENGLIPQNNSIEIFKQHIIDIDKKTAEFIYDEIKEDSEDGEGNNPAPKGNSEGFDEHILINDEIPKEEKEELEKQWKKRLVEASTISKLAGKEKISGMDEYIENLLNPKLDWKSLLYRHITNNIPYDYSWSFPDKKSFSTGIYFPKQLKEMLEVVIAIDSSGSLSQKELQNFLSEIIGIAKSFSNVRMYVIECDYVIRQVLEVRNGDIQKILEIRIKGGGGTSHKPVFNYISENISNCRLFVGLTDGFSDIEEIQNPDYPVLWVLSKNSVPEDYLPFGKSVKIMEE